ncbi:MAG: formylglycine-generating enzyme family protein [Planctomycetaceae bacterium]
MGKQSTQEIAAIYQKHPDAGVHAAAEWVLRQWDQEEKISTIRTELEGKLLPANQRWYLDASGLTFTIVDLDSAQLGSPQGENGRRDDESQRTVAIDRQLAISQTEVPVALFQRYVAESKNSTHEYSLRYSPDASCPQTSVTWYEAVAFCNWLSAQAGLSSEEYCYQPNEDGEYANGMSVVPDATKRKGFRLPSESEWEMFCRAGTVTSRHFGNSAHWLGEYAWYLPNGDDRSWPVASKKPNAWGLFDVHGNVWEWCQDSTTFNAALTTNRQEDRNRASAEDLQIIEDGESRPLRGGSYFYHEIYTRSALRNREPVDARYFGIGLRPVRTLDP